MAVNPYTHTTQEVFSPFLPCHSTPVPSLPRSLSLRFSRTLSRLSLSVLSLFFYFFASLKCLCLFFLSMPPFPHPFPPSFPFPSKRFPFFHPPLPLSSPPPSRPLRGALNNWLLNSFRNSFNTVYFGFLIGVSCQANQIAWSDIVNISPCRFQSQLTSCSYPSNGMRSAEVKTGIEL